MEGALDLAAMNTFVRVVLRDHVGVSSSHLKQAAKRCEALSVQAGSVVYSMS